MDFGGKKVLNENIEHIVKFCINRNRIYKINRELTVKIVFFYDF